MRRILGCILALLGLVAALVGVGHFLAAQSPSSCTGGDPYGLNCGAGDAALQAYLQAAGLAFLVGGLLLGIVPGILLAAWPKRPAAGAPGQASAS